MHITIPLKENKEKLNSKFMRNCAAILPFCELNDLTHVSAVNRKLNKISKELMSDYYEVTYF